MAQVRKGEIVELEIERLAFGGKGVAHLNGYVVFVKGGVPGDKILARIFKKKKNFADAEIIELLVPSADRVKAPCPYFGYCGGCQLQQIDYKRQLSYKRHYVVDSISRIADLHDIPVHDVIPSETSFAYRNKMEFSFCDRKWLLPEEMEKNVSKNGFALGLHVPGTYHKVIDVESCLLQQNTGNEILREVRRYIKESGIPVYGLKTHEGLWRFLVLRYSWFYDEWMVNIVTSEHSPGIIIHIAEGLCGKFKRISTVVNNITRKKASISAGEREIAVIGNGFINDNIGSFSFQISANSFFQTNSLAAKRLYDTVAQFAELSGKDSVLDLYSGTGTIPIFLSSGALTVTGIELMEGAVIDARKNCKQNNVDNCRFICGDIRDELFKIADRPDVMILDPPRAGIHKDILSGVLELSPEKIVYVSCNPTTMARDLGQMVTRYEISEIQPVDLFPHTYHVESVVKMRLRKQLAYKERKNN